MAEEIGQVPADTVDSKSYERIEADRKREIRRQKGAVRDRFDALLRWFSPGIAHETRDDWLRVRRSCDSIRARLLSEGTVTPEIAHQLATANAYLELARDTRDLAETWGLVNQASEVLCQLAEDSEKKVFLQRMETWQPILKRWLNELYEDTDIGKELEEKLDKTNDACQKLAIHSQQWNLVNQWISFSRRLWRLALGILVVALILAIVVAENLYDAPDKAVIQHPQVVIQYPFALISVLGLFGGALSALLTSSARKVTAVTYGQSRSQIFIRLVLGASGAFVVYTLISVPGLINEPVAGFFQKGLQGFLALGIAAGFSERLFKEALERLAQQVPTTAPQTEKYKRADD